LIQVSDDLSINVTFILELAHLKDVIDCAIVCYSVIRFDPDFDGADATEFRLVRFHFNELVQAIFDNFEDTHPNLVDTALQIMAVIKSAGTHSARIKNIASRMFRSGNLNSRYLEVFGMIDMEALLKLLKDGKF
jgi:hypothetical protein